MCRRACKPLIFSGRHSQARMKRSIFTGTTSHHCVMQVREELQQAKAEAAAAARAQAAAAAALLPKEPATEAENAEAEPADTQVRKRASS